MDNYPLGQDRTLALLFLSGLKEGSKVLTLGGMDSQLLISRAGYKAQSLRRGLRGQDAFLSCSYPEQSFDGIISQGDMQYCGDMKAAILKAGSLLRKGGKLMMSELCLEPWDEYFLEAGLEVMSCEDISSMWRAYYMEKMFAGEDVPEWVEGKFKYFTMVCVKN